MFTTVAVLTLGLGIGAATTIYTIADSVLLRKLPYPETDRLVSVWTTRPSWRGRESLDRLWDRVLMSHDEYRAWRDGTSLFEETALYKSKGDLYAVSGAGELERMAVGITTSSLLRVLGIQPTIGRWFLPGEDGPDHERLAVLGHSLWQERFHSDRNVVGTTVTLREDEDVTEKTYTVIGVAPPDMRLRMTIYWKSPGEFSLWRTADVAEKDLWLPVGVVNDLDVDNYEGIGRLRPGVSLEQAAAEIEPLIRGDAPPESRGVRVVPRSDVLSAGLRSQLLLLSVPSGLLLLIAFSNIAALLLGEADNRKREVATRMALGASRCRITRQLLTESVLLGFLGSAMGGFLAMLGTRTLVAIAPPASRLQEVEVFWPTLLFACAAGVGGALLFGLAPAFGSEIRAGELRLQVGAHSSCRVGRGLQSRIVSLQVVCTVMLLVLAGLLTRTLLNLSHVDLGFDRRNLAVVEFLLPDSYSKQELVPYLDEVLERVRALPGIENVGLIQSLPFTKSGGWDPDDVVLEDRPLDPPHRVELRKVSPSYHDVMEIQLLSGRFLSRLDRTRDSRVAVVSETMARALWPDDSPIGMRFRHWGRSYTVVGVVADVRHHGIVEDFVSIAYTPYAQAPTNFAFVIARLNAGSTSALSSIRSAIQSTSSHIVLDESTTMSELVSRHVTDQRFHAYLAAGFGIVAVLLAAAGTFGVAARAVARRSRELAIKKALGATEQLLVGRVVRSGFGQVVSGVLVGLTMAFVVSRYVVAFLFGVSPADPLTYAAVASLVVLICVLASYVPARRITMVDPVEVLRAE
jgi:predicted permease